MKVALLLCAQAADDLILAIFPTVGELLPATLDAKFNFLTDQFPDLPLFDIESLFPLRHLLSADCDATAFAKSFLVQPLVFLRVRPGKMELVRNNLSEAGIDFSEPEASAISVDAGVNVALSARVDKDVVVQDLSSQAVGRTMKEAVNILADAAPLKVWDCCAASGGKSIMLYDIDPTVDLTVTDIRQSIIANLSRRFATAGIQSYDAEVADVAAGLSRWRSPVFDLILADVPCSGSGTWARTPEQLSFFRESGIMDYLQRQQDIVEHAVKALKPGGLLCYITCSVFAAENELQVNWMRDNLKLEVVAQELLAGYEHRADSMFVALLRK